MNFTVEIDPETNPDAVGEYLRSVFFSEEPLPRNQMGKVLKRELREKHGGKG